MTRRGQRATEAALRVATGLGLGVRQAVILNDWNDTIVRLAPSPIVAKGKTGHFRDARLESLKRGAGDRGASRGARRARAIAVPRPSSLTNARWRA